MREVTSWGKLVSRYIFSETDPECASADHVLCVLGKASELDKQAKMHLEEELTASIEEKQQMIEVLQTQVCSMALLLRSKLRAKSSDWHCCCWLLTGTVVVGGGGGGGTTG